MTDLVKEFESLFLKIVGETVGEYGYEFHRSYSRPRGVVLEYIHNDHRLFVASEGGAVILDLILREEADQYWRVSINQALWFSGVRAVSRDAPLDEILALFASEIPRCCSKLFAGDLSGIDRRFCFPISAREVGEYVAAQTGR